MVPHVSGVSTLKNTVFKGNNSIYRSRLRDSSIIRRSFFNTCSLGIKFMISKLILRSFLASFNNKVHLSELELLNVQLNVPFLFCISEYRFIMP